MNSLAPHVLLVEDDVMFRATIRDILRNAGYSIEEAGDGVEAIRRVSERHFDLILLDFDLPRMKGDEALERMLALRPGLICYVLSGKDDLDQALRMGRRGAFGWIDKYVGTDRLLRIVAEGLNTKASGYDLNRLVTTYYPQPIAVPYQQLCQLSESATAADRLAILRDLFEGLVEFLGSTALMTYLQRGLMEGELNRKLTKAVEVPSTENWLNVVRIMLAEFKADERIGFWHELAVLLDRPIVGSDALSETADLTRTVVPGASMASTHTILGWLSVLIPFQSIWVVPTRLPNSLQQKLASSIWRGMDLVLSTLSILADVEFSFIRRVAQVADGYFEHHVQVLSGLQSHVRQLVRPHGLRPGEVYLSSRVAGEPLCGLHPLYLLNSCEIGGLVSDGVFALTRFVHDQPPTYLSRGCGHVRVINAPGLSDAIQRLFYSLDPLGTRFSHLLRSVAVSLFDLSNYTTLTRLHGPAVAREYVRRMVSTVTKAVERNHGQVGGTVGDEVLTYFDDPRDALQASIEAMKTLQGFNARNPGEAFHMHVGIDFGPGVVEGNQVWGDVINRSKRCQMLASQDEIVISPGMFDALGGQTPCPLEVISGELKGFGESAVYQVRWQSPQSAAS